MILRKSFVLIIIKTIHTIVWVIMATASFYILYAGVIGVFDKILLVAIVLLVLETIVLMFNRWTCPLTPVAEKYTNDRRDNFDIYLPLWLARHNKKIFGTIFVMGMTLILVNLLKML